MKYYTIHINDSGAIEDLNETIINNKSTLVCKIYDDKEFNKLNDILHSTDDYIMNNEALKIFSKCNLIPYKLKSAVVKRIEYKLGFLKTTKRYDYTQLKIEESKNLHCYNWINFDKSEIIVTKGNEVVYKLKSHQNLLQLIEKNGNITSQINNIYELNISEKEKKERTENLKTYDWNVKRIVFNNNFDYSIDLFKIPLYSWGTYISDKMKNLLISSKITDIDFAEIKEELGIVWKPHFPIIEFESK